MIDNSQQTAAKIAGVTGLLAVVIVVFGNYVLLGPLIVPRDAAETARNIMAHQTQARAALVCFLLYSANGVVPSGLRGVMAPCYTQSAWFATTARHGTLS